MFTDSYFGRLSAFAFVFVLVAGLSSFSYISLSPETETDGPTDGRHQNEDRQQTKLLLIQNQRNKSERNIRDCRKEIGIFKFLLFMLGLLVWL